MSGAKQYVTHEFGRRASVDELLQQGLELYGQNRVADAVRCWQQVLAAVPGEARALEYLECAGAPPVPAPPQGGVVIELHAAREARAPAPISAALPIDAEVPAVDREELEQLLREKRYEDALLMLYREREHTPGDPAITRGIRMLKEHLTVRYGRELGSLDRIPVLTDGDAVMSRATPEQRQVLRLIDGLATFGDVLVSSRLGRFETTRLLATLLQRGAISARAPSVLMAAVRPAAVEPPRSEPPPEPVPSTRPSASVPPQQEPATRAEPAAVDDGYDGLFARATEAYLGQQYVEALQLYEACLAIRPGDWRAENNVGRLRARLGGGPTSPA